MYYLRRTLPLLKVFKRFARQLYSRLPLEVPPSWGFHMESVFLSSLSRFWRRFDSYTSCITQVLLLLFINKFCVCQSFWPRFTSTSNGNSMRMWVWVWVRVWVWMSECAAWSAIKGNSLLPSYIGAKYANRFAVILRKLSVFSCSSSSLACLLLCHGIVHLVHPPTPYTSYYTICSKL